MTNTDYDEPFHEGEREIQRRTGEREAAAENGRNIAQRIPAAARGFVEAQRYCVLGGRDGGDDLWALVLAGEAGFAGTNDERDRLELDLADPVGVLGETPPLADLTEQAHVGVLFIELATRRRLRVNGRLRRGDARSLCIAVDQACPLCPKYIQRRNLEAGPGEPGGSAVTTGRALTAELAAWIEGADTFFVASAHPEGPADVSHRGGRPGFVRVSGNTLMIPDYPGNSMFNTFGNFALNPRAGLVFVDFEGDRQLQLTGGVELSLDGGDAPDATGGTGRWWRFHAERWRVSPLNAALEWAYVDASPFNP